ncbi:TPA: YeeE/YedE family protein [Candidatus Woesearchaeota archaeon]|nr:YeeE/YedE family protein [Candidatus Woesearchaeota archaeon]HIH92437.1 YeeE/YedE family protein [Candidatus Woesearchaeota archaeon]HII64247.1 YeeE/YedE family protein [Candidatus Woesearchaeota archaeon]
MFEQFFPNGMLHYLAGGLLIGAGVSFIFLMTGLVSGTSTFFSSAWSYFSTLPFFRQKSFLESRQWRLAFALGLALGGFAFLLTLGNGQAASTGVQWWRLLAGGALAGFGARMAGGCTSGHGICGLSSLQLPSLAAVITFLTTAIITAHAVQLAGVLP